MFRTVLDPRTRVRLQRGVIVALWLVVIVFWIRYQRSEDLGFTDVAQRFVDAARGSWWAIPAFVGIFLLRPLVLFPPALLAIAAGVLFGPLLGVVVVLVALNASGTVAWALGRSLSNPAAGSSGPEEPGRSRGAGARRWAARIRANAFQTVLVMRLVMIPFDVVNYLCGYLRVRWTPFVTATALGVVPSTVAIVLAGASVDRLDQGVSGIDPRLLVASVVLVAVSLVVAWSLKRRSSNGSAVHAD